MLAFLYLLASMGLAYWAKLNGRNPLVWFLAAVVITPLGASLALILADRVGVRI